MSVLDLVIESAHAGRGRTLDPGQTREAAKDIITMSERLEWTQNMIVAYMNEFGPELFYELAGEGVVEGELEAEGPSAESAGQDAQNEEEGEMDVSDEDQRDPSPDEEIIGGYGGTGEESVYVL